MNFEQKFVALPEYNPDYGEAGPAGGSAPAMASPNVGSAMPASPRAMAMPASPRAFIANVYRKKRKVSCGEGEPEVRREWTFL